MSIDAYIKGNRRDFQSGDIAHSQIPLQPQKLFSLWFEQVIKAKVLDANAMVLSTSYQNQPSSRVVLLRGFDDNGLVFYTNYNSSKGRAIEKNPKVALNFFWAELNKQIRIEGTVQKISPEKSDEYFMSRPKESRLAAWASDQSSIIESRASIEKAFDELKKQFKDEVHRPKHWGGYLVIPHYFEFWQGKPNRLHDRIAYQLEKGNWKIVRLAP